MTFERIVFAIAQHPTSYDPSTSREVEGWRLTAAFACYRSRPGDRWTVIELCSGLSVTPRPKPSTRTEALELASRLAPFYDGEERIGDLEQIAEAAKAWGREAR